jgi:muconolactone delta-isomerase
MAEYQQYMVSFTLPQTIGDDFSQLIPEQRAEVARLFASDKLASYSLSLESGKLWAIVNAESEHEVREVIGGLPLSRYMKARIFPLTFHNSAARVVPSFSLN